MAHRSQAPIEPSPLRKRIWTLVVLGWAVGTGVALWYAYQAKQAAILAEGGTPPAPSSTTSPPESPTGQDGVAAEEEFVQRAKTVVEFPPLPLSLNESDAWLRQEVAAVDRNPQLLRWLDETPQVLYRFVVLVNEIAHGKVPRKLFEFWAPQEPLQVKEKEGGEYLLDPASYHRYDALASAVEALDPELAVRLYRYLKPLISQVYAELGPPGADFDQVLIQAIEHLLKTPQPPAEVYLRKHSVTYRYQDPQLEGLSAAQKQLLALGPVNGAIVKHKLALLRALLSQ